MSVYEIYNSKLFQFITSTCCDLSNASLHQLDEKLFTFKHIEILDLSENQLYELPDAISNLKNLKTLIWNDPKFVDII